MPRLAGFKHTEETKRKISLAQRGKKFSEEHKKRLSESRRGKHASEETRKRMSENSAKYWEGKHLYETTKKKIGKATKKRLKNKKNHPFYGKHHSKEIKERISKTIRETFKKGRIVWNKGKKCPQISKAVRGEKSPHWLGGISFEPYGLKFDKKLKEEIRRRDNYTCQECGYAQDELGYALSIHHIDYDKKNNEKDNLIALCKNCHQQTNFGREDWTSYFSQKVYR